MYLPPAFREEDLGRLHGLMREHSFAILVTQDGEAPFATHLPLLLDEARGPLGALRGHVARANPQWRCFSDQEALAIFSGPHAYVSPAWYETELSVPTWNYVAVHAYGRVRLLEGEGELDGLLRDLVAEYEAGRPEPWADALPAEYRQGLMQGIVGFELEITRLEGKRKLSQNRSAADRAGVIEGLLGQGTQDATAVAQLMQARDA